ncbi:N-formylglutamate amidohydrolase [Brevundimonas sp. DC300-4]|uniref:N-formylglutamate amidohydrolase n=1 Tax=Brevundimonas sp. DC300-4 TaxID=2804594 RepID=UPI003CECC9BB
MIDVNRDPAGASPCKAGPFSRVINGRFRGGSITRHYGRPEMGINAIPMELACRWYMDDPAQAPEPTTWPSPSDPQQAEPLRATLQAILIACLTFTETPSPS